MRHNTRSKIPISAMFAFLLSSPAWPCDDVVSSFEAKVLKEKILCLSSGSCLQEISVKTKDGSLTITNSKKPWVDSGDEVEVLKLKGSNYIVYSGRRVARGSQSHFYKLARYCEAP